MAIFKLVTNVNLFLTNYDAKIYQIQFGILININAFVNMDSQLLAFSVSAKELFFKGNARSVYINLIQNSNSVYVSVKMAILKIEENV